MASVRLSDVIVPEVFNAYMQKNTMVNSLLKSSGVLRSDDRAAKFLAGGGRTVNLPYWSDLDNTEANISSDDPDSMAVPMKIGTFKDIAIRNNRNASWRDTDLTTELAGSDPMQAIGKRVVAYWDRQINTTLVNVLKGVFYDNADNDSGDMINDITTTGSVTDAARISAEAVIDTAQTMGDSDDALSLMIMHSVPYRKLQKLNLIDFKEHSNGLIKFPTYLGYPVIITDTCPALANATTPANTDYWTFLMGRGSIVYNEHAPAVPSETDRVPLGADGGGYETLTTRKQFLMHPSGIKFTDTSVSKESPTNAEFALATNWDRVYPERKQVSMALLKTSG